MQGKAVVAALFSTLLLPLLLTQQPRAIAALADHLSVGASGTTALFEACGSRFLDLVSRGNMILLCNAILLIVLKDAGLLACPAPAAARHNGDDASSSRSVAAAVASSRRRPHVTRSSVVVVWRPSKLPVVDVLEVDENGGDDDNRLRRRRPTQRHEPATVPTMALSVLPPAGEEEKHSSDGLDDDSVSDGRVSAGANVMVVEAKMSSPVSDSHHHHYAGEDTNGRDDDDDAEALDQCGGDHDDVDDMNRRFDEFIANTKRKMQLESLQLQLVMKV